MNEPIITCPHCKAEVRLTESLAAPLIQATRKKIVERECEVARRESAIQAQRAELARAVELAEQQLTTRLKTEREIAAEEAKNLGIALVELLAYPVPCGAAGLRDIPWLARLMDWRVAEKARMVKSAGPNR